MHYSSSDVCALSKLSLDTGSEREMKETKTKEIHKKKKKEKKKDNSYLQFRFHHYNLTN